MTDSHRVPPGDGAVAVRVGLLECDHTDPGLRGIDGDYADMFTALFAAHAPQLQLSRIDLIGGEVLPRLDDHDAYLVTGSRLDAVAEEGWIVALADFLRRAHDAGKPTVGICFGHQLIAHALGGRVERASLGWGIGVHQARLTPTAAAHRPELPGCFSLLLSHQDQVLALPPGGEVLATSEHAPVAAFRVGSLLGFQGHPEFTVPYATALMDSRTDRIGAEAIALARRTLGSPTDHAAVARWIGRHLADAT